MTNQINFCRSVQGVALLQVLLITAILSLLAMHFTLTSRNQVAIAATLQDKIQAEVLLNDWQNKILYALLTQPLTGAGQELTENNDVAGLWNFYGKTFLLEKNVKVSIQDLNGLISLNYANTTNFQKLFTYFNVPAALSKNILFYIQQKSDRGRLAQSSLSPALQTSDSSVLFFQSVDELKQLSEVSPKLYQQLEPLLTAGPAKTFNFLNAPEHTLRAFFPQDIAEELIRLRDQKQLTIARFLALTGIQDIESLAFVPSQFQLVHLEVTYGRAVAKTHFICYIRPESQIPLVRLD